MNFSFLFLVFSSILIPSLTLAQQNQTETPGMKTRIERSLQMKETVVVSEKEIGDASGAFFSLARNKATVYVYAMETFPFSKPSERSFGLRFLTLLEDKNTKRVESFNTYVDVEDVDELVSISKHLMAYNGKNATFPALGTTATLKNGMQVGVYRMPKDKKMRFMLGKENGIIGAAEIDADDFVELLEEAKKELDIASANYR